ncbi:uncharacterized protein [Penaeus vannamei]|uniref:uncharacterized protein isoform X2 n=1 Tax=Penaeus vannamei TaxID=6689 RepID=UPI00387F7947
MWPKVIILLPLLLASGVTAQSTTLGTTTSSSQSTTLGNCSFDGGIYWTGDKLEDSCLILECVGDTWQPTGSISNNCSMCSLRNDPHFTGFYGYTYDFHGFLEYYIAMDIDAYGVIGDFHPCNAFASCLDIITYKDDADTIITFDKDDGNSILVNGESFAVNNVVQNVQSAGGVVHPVLAWKQGGCIRVVGTRRIAVSFCIHDMYIWAENAILGDLAGLCFGGRDFGFRPAGRFQRLPASQWDIDEWGQSLQVSGNNTGPLETTTVPPILECVTEDEQIYFECQGLFGETSASDGLHEAAVDFCKVDLCAMTLSGANQVEIDAWKTKMVVMLDNTIEVINNTLPPDHPQTTEAPTSELNIRQSVYVAIVLITIYIVFFIIIMHFNLICITQG